MMDATKVIPSYNRTANMYEDMNGILQASHAVAAQNNMLVLTASIASSLSRIAASQEALRSDGREAMTKADASLSKAFGELGLLGGVK